MFHITAKFKHDGFRTLIGISGTTILTT